MYTLNGYEYIYDVKHVKNIIFDLGGVLLPVDYQAVLTAFAKLGTPQEPSFYSQQAQHPIFDQLEKGEISGGEFLFELKKQFPNASETDLTFAWNAILGKFSQERLELLKKIKKHYRIFLLSNTNAIHAAQFLKDLKEYNGIENFGDFFDEIYYSHETGFRKPDKEIFGLVILENNLDTSETIFIEDTEANVKGAVAAGLPTVWMKVHDGESLEMLFTPDGILKDSVPIIYP